ncbi:hypothetical protein HMPREF2738_03066 [Clostridiales bacterium KLE1615]|nr:hypothetical protein HMPREF2738_03066 [Clostridiales bacterium KLE1615]
MGFFYMCNMNGRERKKSALCHFTIVHCINTQKHAKKFILFLKNTY